MVRSHRHGLAAACLLIVLTLGLGFAAARAATAKADVPTPTPSPTVVRELTNLRAANSETFLMSDGKRRAQFYASPIHFQNAAGAWQDFDTNLVVSAPGTYAPLASPLGITIGDGSKGASSAELSVKGFTIGLALRGTQEGVALVSGDTATYPAAGVDTSVAYKVLRGGLEQTIELHSPKAPNAFTCYVSHPGLTLRKDATGLWGFYREGSSSPICIVTPLLVSDSSADGAGLPAYCDAASMTVVPGAGASTLTYTVPENWLSDPARVYPVRLDPTYDGVEFFPGAGNATFPDTCLSSASPSSSFSSATTLNVGKDSTGYWRSLLKVDLSSIPSNAFVDWARVGMWKTYSGGHNGTTYVGQMNQSWSAASTWSSLGCAVNSFPSSLCTSLGSVSGVPANNPLWFDSSPDYGASPALDALVQKWVNGTVTNNGVVFWQSESGSENSTYFSKYGSMEGSNDPSYQPEFVVFYEVPSTSLTLDKSSYRVGDTVTATMRVSGYFSCGLNDDGSGDVQEMQILVNKAAGNQSLYRGNLGWFSFNPNNNPAQHWTTRKLGAHSYLAYEAAPGTANGTRYVTPDLVHSTLTHFAGEPYENDFWQVAFKFKVNDSFGNLQANSISTMFGMVGTYDQPISLSSQEYYAQGWTPAAPTFNVLPKPLAALSYATTATANWWQPSQGNNDTNGQGRGSVSLSWPAAPVADGYRIYLWDGHQYDHVGTTTATTWSSAGKGLYPSDTQIAAIPLGSTANPFLSGSGLELRDNPNALYRRMATGEPNYQAQTDYRFCVVPYNATSGALPLTDNATVSVTLDNRTLLTTNDPQHTSYDLGSWDGHGAQARLDAGALDLAVTDLAITSWGPQAALSRVYSSTGTSTNDFAPGWFFSFRQSLQIGSDAVVYTDESGLTHVFRGSGSSWTAPNGYVATLAPTGSTWRLTLEDQSYLTFNSSGVLVSETDHDGNAVTYAWASGNLTITAANGQSIAVTFTGGLITRATYTVTINSQPVTRQVDYVEGTTPRVTYFPGSQLDERAVTYAYDANNHLTGISQQNWPSAGSTASEQFVYTGGVLTEVRYPDYYAPWSKVDAHAVISYAASQATVNRYGTVNGVANQQIAHEVDIWNQTGNLASTTVGTTSPVTTTYNYSSNLQLGNESCSDGTQTTYAVDSAGNTTAETTTSASGQSANATTTYVYDSSHRVTQQTDYQGPNVAAITNSTYNASGDLTEEQRLDGASNVISDSKWTLDAQGRTTSEMRLVSGTPASGTWTETDYANFYASGEPGTTTYKSISLTHGGTAQDLSVIATYDPFGELLTKSDQSGSRIVETNTYDLAGNQLTSCDATGMTTTSTYDCLGYKAATWETASGTQMKANWQAFVCDPLGRVTQEKSWLWDAGHPSGQLQKTVTNTYDGLGQEISSTDSTMGGQPERWYYDQDGNVIAHWAMGVVDYSSGRATQDSYDAQNRVLAETAPGSANATTYVYDFSDKVLKQTNPDGSWVAYTYDGDGNKTSEVRPKSGYDAQTNPLAVAVTSYAYDLADRLIAQSAPPNSAAGLTTIYANDLIGRQTGAAGQVGGSPPATAIEYNDLDQVLQKVDADGVTDSRTYDAHGCVTAETVGSQGTTSSTYDAGGRLLTQTDPNGNILTNTYDAFANLTEEKHQNASLAVLKDVITAPDSLGRPATVHETTSTGGWTRTYAYPVNAATGVRETLAYDASSLTSTVIACNARNMETSRVTTIASGSTVTRAVADTTSGRDNADRWKQATITKSGYSALTLGRGFDNAGRLTSQSGAGFSSAGSYAYDASCGQKITDNLPLALGGTLSGSYSYSADRRLSSATIGGLVGSYSFDEAGNLVSDAEGSTTTSFSYDSASRLTQTTGAATTYYGWDATNGWRTCQGPNASPTTANEPIVFTYTKSGASTSNARLRRYQNTTTDASYTYDASGQRTQSAVTVGSTTTSTSFTYDGLSLLKLSATQDSSSWRIDYLSDEEGAAYGGVYRSPATSTSPTYFTMITSDRGDVLELLDAAGNAFAAYRYDAWGLPRGSGNYATGVWTQSTSLITSTLAGQIASRQVLRYASYAYDAESGLYYCSARYYDPATRQWMTADSAKADGEESAYQYCGGDPIQHVDPSGTVHSSIHTESWSGKGHGHPTWSCNLSVRVTWDVETVQKLQYFKIVGISGKVSKKKGKFYVVGSCRAHVAGDTPTANMANFETRWPLNDDGQVYWDPLYNLHSMTPGEWYDNWDPVTWLKGKAWHKDSEASSPAPGYITPEERARCRFQIRKNSDGTIVDSPNISSMVVWDE